MRRIVLLFCLLNACGSASPTPQWPQSPCRITNFEQSRFTICEAEPNNLRLIAARRDGAAPRGFADLAAKVPTNRVAFAMNAGMFDTDGRPIGLAVVDGQQVHSLNLRDGGGNFHLKPNGVFLVRRNGNSAIIRSESFTMSPDIALATQSGPMLVIDGVIHPRFDTDGSSRFIRNGVGIAPNGKPQFVISNEVVSFGKFARFFRDRLGTKNALYFDGSVSSLWDPANGRMDAGVPIGPMIVALKPAGSAPGREGRATP